MRMNAFVSSRSISLIRCFYNVYWVCRRHRSNHTPRMVSKDVIISRSHLNRDMLKLLGDLLKLICQELWAEERRREEHPTHAGTPDKLTHQPTRHGRPWDPACLNTNFARNKPQRRHSDSAGHGRKLPLAGPFCSQRTPAALCLTWNLQARAEEVM